MSDTSSIVDRLVQKEFVEKSIDNHTRAVDIIISDKGLSLLKKMDTENWFF